MKPLLKATAITGSAFFLNLVVNTIRAKLVAIYLGPAGVAALAQINAFTGLVITLCTLGLVAAVVRFVAEYHADERLDELKTLIVTTTVVVGLISTLTTLLLVIFTRQTSHWIFGKEVFLLLIALSLINIPVSAITNLCVALLQGLKEIKLDAVLSVFSSIVAGILLVGLLIPFGLTGAIVGSLIANYVTSAVFFYYVVKTLRKGSLQALDMRISKAYGSFRAYSLRPLVSIAIASLLGGSITNFSDILVRSHLIQTFGFYAAGAIQPALSISAQYTGLLSGAIGTYALARLSELSNRPEPLRVEHNHFLRLMLLMVTPAACALALLARYLVPILYSSKFAVAGPLIPYQSVADVAKFCYIGVAGVFLPMGRGKILLVMGVATPLIYYGLYRVLVPFIGLRSIPVASGLSWGLAALASYLVLTQALHMTINGQNIWLMLNSLLVTLAVAIIVNRAPLVIGLIAGLGLLIFWLTLNMRREDYQAISQIARNRLVR